MQNSRQLFTNIRANGNIAVAIIDKRLVCQSYTDSDIIKVEERTTLSEKLIKRFRFVNG